MRSGEMSGWSAGIDFGRVVPPAPIQRSMARSPPRTPSNRLSPTSRSHSKSVRSFEHHFPQDADEGDLDHQGDRDPMLASWSFEGQIVSPIRARRQFVWIVPDHEERPCFSRHWQSFRKSFKIRVFRLSVECQFMARPRSGILVAIEAAVGRPVDWAEPAGQTLRQDQPTRNGRTPHED